MSITMEKARPLVEYASPDICDRHYRFEIFVRQKLFPVTRYELLVKKYTGLDDSNDFNELLKEPHFKLKSRYAEFTFYADAKYLFQNYNPMVEWCTPAEFRRYQAMDDQLPVYILIGQGPHPDAPEDVFLFPVKNVRYNSVLRSNLKKYRIPTDREIFGREMMSLRLAY